MRYEMTQPAIPGFEAARQGTPTKERGQPPEAEMGSYMDSPCDSPE